jgi:hypothetical protein
MKRLDREAGSFLFVGFNGENAMENKPAAHVEGSSGGMGSFRSDAPAACMLAYLERNENPIAKVVFW